MTMVNAFKITLIFVFYFMIETHVHLLFGLFMSNLLSSIQRLFLRSYESDLSHYSAWNITGTYKGLYPLLVF